MPRDLSLATATLYACVHVFGIGNALTKKCFPVIRTYVMHPEDAVNPEFILEAQQCCQTAHHTEQSQMIWA